MLEHSGFLQLQGFIGNILLPRFKNVQKFLLCSYAYFKLHQPFSKLLICFSNVMDTEKTGIYLTVLIAASFLAIILFVFIVIILWHHKKRLALYKEKVSNEIAILEMERKRIGHDLHDDLGPILSSIKLQLNCFTTTNAVDIAIKDRCSVLIAETIQKIRETSNNLIPDIVERKGLAQALKRFAELISKSEKLRVNIEVEEPIEIEKNKGLHLYRIFQEITSNCIRHSNATILTLVIKKKQKNIIFIAHENGQGFEYERKLKENIGLGLKNIVNRVDIIKGRLFIESAASKGVTYTIEMET
jgi:signal transduction histidine kinase